ncbi:hypothetical protein BC941DRAFT_426970 [Chlamydoabsidia padenii]|nr:hypothetical protein BC941DRAFT_426970 [Chlamydoabsidia padenii]
MASSIYWLLLTILLSLLYQQTSGQHTTRPSFTPVPKSSGVYCIQMVCPSQTGDPPCPSDCQSGCKFVPDQCCPQVTIASCQDGASQTSTSSSSGLGSSPTFHPTSTTTLTSPPSSSPTGSANNNTGLDMRPSFWISLVLILVISSFII